jgi:cell division protein YceG involved in septum cleavage
MKKNQNFFIFSIIFILLIAAVIGIYYIYFVKPTPELIACQDGDLYNIHTGKRCPNAPALIEEDEPII